jgi:DNA-binding NtrC family response regulator
MQTPEAAGLVQIDGEFTDASGSQTKSDEAIEPPRFSTASAPASDFGILHMISSEGQVKTLEEIEAETIRFAIEVYNGRMSEIARRLNIGRSTLYRKLKEHGIAEDSDN